jgi:hypothetical protein
MISEHDRMMLKRSGFIDTEIKQFEDAPSQIDFSNDRCRQVMKDREKYFKRMRASGLTYPQYEKKQLDWYRRNKDVTAFDFLKSEYGRFVVQEGKQPSPSDARAAKIVKRKYGTYWWKA